MARGFTCRAIILVAALFAVTLAAGSEFYQVDAEGWLRHNTPDGEVFTCKACTEQVQIQISLGPELPTDAPYGSNSEFIASLSTQAARSTFATAVMEKSVPGEFEINIDRTAISNLGGLDVFQFAATVEFGPTLSFETSMVALHRNRIVKVSLNYLDGAMNEETSQTKSRFFESFEFV